MRATRFLAAALFTAALVPMAAMAQGSPTAGSVAGPVAAAAVVQSTDLAVAKTTATAEKGKSDVADAKKTAKHEAKKAKHEAKSMKHGAATATATPATPAIPATPAK